ncbi:MAG: efflux RND transporter permease subunit [Methylococcaceae bacterium]|nr:efflux RND transporter permease subunit [Methylococcaceae bacterium]
MLRWIISASLRLRVLVIASAVLLVIVGAGLVPRIPMDVFPEFAPPLVEIQTEAPGLSTEEVESLVTLPLEFAVNGTSWLKTMRSKSVLGLSSIQLIFERGTDLMRARQLVQERLSTASVRLPSVARPPVILPPLSSTSRALKIGIWSERLDQMALTDLALWTIRPRLMAVPGVANVAIWGQRDRQLQVLVNPDRLRALNVTLDQVIQAARGAVVISGGGFIDTPNQRLALRHEATIESPEELARTVVRFTKGVPLRLGDVADVVVGHPPAIGDAVINDGPGLLLIVEKQPWGNTLEVTRKVEAALEKLKPGLQDIEIDSTIFRPATFIEQSIDNLSKALLAGCVLVVAILVVFLYDWRTALISLSAIPLSLLAAGVVLYLSGGTMNTMVLAGLVIAVGEVVDDAIIDVENIMRRLRLNRLKEKPEPAFNVVLLASLEVRSAVVFASLIVVLVFLPVFFMGGLAGTFFRPLAFSYVLAILASLCVALTVTPAMCLWLLPEAPERSDDAPLVKWLKSAYLKILPGSVRNGRRAVFVLLSAFFLTGLALTQLGEEFLPNFKERDFLMHWVEKPGTSLDAMRRITINASKELRAVPGVRNFGSHIGRAEVADEVVGPNFTELWISLDPEVDYDSTLATIQEIVDGYPGLYRDVLTYLKERIKEVLTGASATIVVRVFGPELDVLRGKAQEIAKSLETVEGVVDLKVEPQVLVPQIQVRVDTDAAAQFGLTPGQVRDAINTLIRGRTVGELYQEQKIIGVAVWGEPGIRSDLNALKELRIETAFGSPVSLDTLADIEIVPTPNTINREGGARRIDVTCNVRGKDLGSVAAEIEKKLRTIQFDQGYHPELLGEFTEQRTASRRLLALSLIALAGILVLLQIEFASTRLMLLVALTLPFALIGGVIGAFLGGAVLSLGSLVGFVTVLGIAARNGILMISHFKHLEANEGEPFGAALVLRGAKERLAPILMTASTAGLALLPIIAGGNLPGHEIEYPMAVVIVGGLVTSTILNLYLVPALYLAFARTKTHY